MEQQAGGNPTNGPQHLWLSGYNARTIATLKDHVWWGVIQIEVYKATLNPIHEIMFPTGPRVQGINALLDVFRGVGPIRNFIMERLIMEANATMAYIRGQRQTLTFRPPVLGSTLTQQDMDVTLDLTQLIVDHFRGQLDPVVKVKVEP